MNAADTRQRILMTAMELFWEKGYLSTSVADILSRSQVHSGSLYHFFPGKQDVLVGVLELYRDGIDAMLLAPNWDGVDDPIDKVFALLAGYRTHLIVTDCTYGCPIGSLALEIHEPDPVVRELMAANFSNWSAAIAGCFEAAADRLPKDTDRKALGEFVLTVMEGAVMQARTYRDIGYFDRNIAVLRDYITILLATEKSANFA
ncbi:TetR/AcrR family transcriptional regulator [Sphingopyxis sp. SE2]|jgi:AcrR family transcriptional regulator|uniref:TetR/AcrR family transcriptional regulator n=1 Tax=unclassified Sphingopyxis TaxID=2614943 RepID=UPI00050E1655|nr:MULTISPECIES: TetR/AcrR family transcriptional regulator [unclassified Sphingopyxis]KGB55326.1 Transcriptional regulator, TetR family [Sphingopyxis sp. LC363]MDT7528693.1 TetR/AcrR family transcriptional regulator [Sphingopyxis sp. SE2]